ncbi:MAG TPA: hypothetical protein VMU71_05780, partial [Terracidiphilus sp.]|nr:hypothetical protein [Terracidiphilus sp.]
MPTLLLVLASICLAACSAPLNAQATPTTPIPMASEGQPQTIHLDVLVKDKRSGQPLSGLPEPAFTVKDNGQPQKLIGFKAVNANADPEAVHVLIVLDMINIG